MVEHPSAMDEVLVQSPVWEGKESLCMKPSPPFIACVALHTIPCAREIEAGRLGVQSQTWLHTNFQTSLATGTPHVNNKRKENCSQGIEMAQWVKVLSVKA